LLADVSGSLSVGNDKLNCIDIKNRRANLDISGSLAVSLMRHA